MSSFLRQDGEEEEDEVEEQELEEDDKGVESLGGGWSFSELFFLLLDG